MSRKKKIFLGLLVAFIIAQFFRIDKTNPTADPALDFITMKNPPSEVANILKTACYDCHSNTTTYPWYSNVAPVSWWLKGHIKEGRENLNFSEYGNYKADEAKHIMREVVEVVGDKEMPMLSYMIAHRDAWLSQEQRDVLVSWFKEQHEN